MTVFIFYFFLPAFRRRRHHALAAPDANHRFLRGTATAAKLQRRYRRADLVQLGEQFLFFPLERRNDGADTWPR